MKILVVLVAVIVVSLEAANLHSFKLFKTKFNKTYASQSEENRRAVNFVNNLEKIEQHNKRYREGLETYTLGVNKFADLTQEEFAKYLEGQGQNPATNDGEFFFKKLRHFEGPEQVDWRDQNAVSSVKDQDLCGSCWAFSAIGAVESLNFLKTGKMVDLSEQQLVDCSGGFYGNNGCDGGWMGNAFLYIKDNGITTEEQYPYRQHETTCKSDTVNMTDIKLTNRTFLRQGDVGCCNNWTNFCSC